MDGFVGIPVVQRLRRYIREDHADTYIAEEIAPMPRAEGRDVAAVISVGIDLIYADVWRATLLCIAVYGKTSTGIDFLCIGAHDSISCTQKAADLARRVADVIESSAAPVGAQHIH